MVDHGEHFESVQSGRFDGETAAGDGSLRYGANCMGATLADGKARRFAADRHGQVRFLPADRPWNPLCRIGTVSRAMRLPVEFNPTIS